MYQELIYKLPPSPSKGGESELAEDEQSVTI